MDKLKFMKMLKSKTYKRRITIFVIGILIVLGVFIGTSISHKTIDSLPSLKQISQMEDEAELNSYITNFTKNELRIVWGEPNESSKTEDVWYINDNTKLIVNYHNNSDKAIICGIEKR